MVAGGSAVVVALQAVRLAFALTLEPGISSMEILAVS